MITVNFGTSAEATAVTIFAPCLAMPSCSYLRPTMKPVMFCRKTSGILRRQHISMKCAPLTRALREEDAVVGENADRVAHDAREPADERRAVSRLELVEAAAVDDAGDDLAHVVGAARGRPGRCRRCRRGRMPAARAASAPTDRSSFGRPRLATMLRTMSSASSSVSAKWSATPEIAVCTSAPPSSSAETISPVAAFTSGGPPRKIVPVPSTITVSSLIAGT